MGNLEEIIYSPLMEEQKDDVTGWSKETVRYVSKYKAKVERQIRNVARGMRKFGLQPTDVEDIYEELMMYLYKSDDYNLNKAIERSSSGTIVSLEGYVNSCIKYCVLRYCTQLNSHDRDTISESIKGDDDKELSIFDNIADIRSEINLDHLVYDLPTICKSCETIRYRFGPDLYLVWYVRLLTITDKTGNTFKRVLEVLGITHKDLSKLSRYNEDNVMMELAKAITLSSAEKALAVLERYVYSAKLVKQAVINQMA